MGVSMLIGGVQSPEPVVAPETPVPLAESAAGQATVTLTMDEQLSALPAEVNTAR